MKQQKWTPETFVEKLKENVIGQDRYLKDLCTSVWMHSLSKDAEERLGHSVDGVKSKKIFFIKLFRTFTCLSYEQRGYEASSFK